MKRAILIVLGCFLLASSAAWADDATQKRAVDFVQTFYTWYIPIALKTLKEPSSNVAIAKRGSLFDPPLLKALKEDAEASQKSSGDIVGLDFDPFLYAQDIDNKYVVGEVSEEGGLYLVNVYSVRKGKRAAKPDVVAELKPAKDTFVFSNFRYGADGDLVQMLKEMAVDRAHPSQ
ncbi:MAG TPA: hypothetical protein VJN67_08140 [Stellaceae bacterium]|nr:hypothetical protein [Stellaceae bacterium]